MRSRGNAKTRRGQGRSRQESQARPATSVDVARLAGVSRAAVSRTYTPGASVSAETRDSVLRAAKSLNYRPNLFARSLKTRRSHILGLAVSSLDNFYYPTLVQRLSEEFALAGYRLLLFVTHGATGPDPMIEELFRYRLDGLILASSTLSSKLAEESHAAGVPVVMYNNVDPASRVSTVTSANYAGARTIAQFLMASGHRRYAFLSGLESDSSSFERERGFRDAIVAAGLPPPRLAAGHFRYDDAAQATREILRNPERPDALFCANDHMAVAAMGVARYEFGLVPGQDLSIVGFDNASVAGLPEVSLTSYSQPTELIVTRIIDLIRRPLEQGEHTAIHESLQGELIVRRSARVPTSGVVDRLDGIRVWYPPPPGPTPKA